MNIPEKVFLGKCKKLIEEKLSWAESSEWKQRDFENLIELIFDKTQILLSLSTLKRLWKNSSDSIPHPATLNALAQFLEYKNWLEFKQKIAEEINKTQPKIVEGSNKKKRGSLKPSFYISLIVLIGLIIVVFSITFYVQNNFDEVKFSSKTVVTEGVPNTVIFDYDISKISFDSAFIQQSWNPLQKAAITKQNYKYTSVYYYPGSHRAKLIIDNQVIREHNILVKSDGWLGIARYSFEDAIPIYIPKENIFSYSRMYISPKTLTNNNVNVAGREFLVSFYNVRDFDGLEGDNFIFETSVKNDLAEGGLTCQYMLLTILTDGGRIILPLSMEGCVANIYLKFIEKWVRGRENDLSPFGCDMSEWNKLKCINDNKNVNIELNGEKIYEVSYQNSAGNILGIVYTFFGCGSVNYLKFSDFQGISIYEENFSSKLN
ncbi:hypothetical protein ACFLTH_09055 [Bacteroidota bacterium]